MTDTLIPYFTASNTIFLQLKKRRRHNHFQKASWNFQMENEILFETWKLKQNKNKLLCQRWNSHIIWIDKILVEQYQILS